MNSVLQFHFLRYPKSRLGAGAAERRGESKKDKEEKKTKTRRGCRSINRAQMEGWGLFGGAIGGAEEVGGVRNERGGF